RWLRLSSTAVHMVLAIFPNVIWIHIVRESHLIPQHQSPPPKPFRSRTISYLVGFSLTWVSILATFIHEPRFGRIFRHSSPDDTRKNTRRRCGLQRNSCIF